MDALVQPRAGRAGLMAASEAAECVNEPRMKLLRVTAPIRVDMNEVVAGKFFVV